MEVLKINYRNLHTKNNELLPDNISILDFMVENQTLFGEKHLSNYGDNEWFNDFYNRTAIGAVKKIYEPNNFLISKIVSVQPMKGPAGVIKFLRFKHDNAENDIPKVNLVIEQENVSAVARHMKLEFPLVKITPEATTDLKHYHNGYFLTKDFSDKYPDAKEEEIISYMADNFTNEVSKEVLTDLLNNVGTVASGEKWKDYEGFYVGLVKVSGVIHRKTLRGGCNWIVVSPKTMNAIIADYKYSNLKDRDNDMELFYHGVMNSHWRMYSSKTIINDNVALLGYKGESSLDAGYFYNPYIPIGPLEKAPMEEEIRFGTMSRYSKKLIREGSKYYGRINFGSKNGWNKTD